MKNNKHMLIHTCTSNHKIVTRFMPNKTGERKPAHFIVLLCDDNKSKLPMRQRIHNHCCFRLIEKDWWSIVQFYDSRDIIIYSDAEWGINNIFRCRRVLHHSLVSSLYYTKRLISLWAFWVGITFWWAIGDSNSRPFD